MVAWLCSAELSRMHTMPSHDLSHVLLGQVKETLAAIQERAKVLGLQADALHLTRLAGGHARPLSVRKITMYSAAWVKSQVRGTQQLADRGVSAGCAEVKRAFRRPSSSRVAIRAKCPSRSLFTEMFALVTSANLGICAAVPLVLISLSLLCSRACHPRPTRRRSELIWRGASPSTCCGRWVLPRRTISAHKSPLKSFHADGDAA